MSIILPITKSIEYCYQGVVLLMRVYFCNENRYFKENNLEVEKLTIIEKIKNQQIFKRELFTNFAINVINCYIEIKNYTVKRYINLYNSYWVVRTPIDYFQYTKYVITSFIKRKYFKILSEPTYEEWISLSQLIKEPVNDELLYKVPQYKYVETYYNITDCDIDIIEQIIDALFIDLFNTRQLENLVIIKTGDGHYISQVIENKKDISKMIKILIDRLNPIKSPFLTVEYSHPRMQKPILIEIDKGLFLENNHILSPLFIKRYLEYQSEPYYFDLDYKITIMDKNINLVDLCSNDYIEFNKKGYTIKVFR
jgi:hypothetical protein